MEQLNKRKICIGFYLFVLATFFVVTNSDSTSPFFLQKHLDSNIFQYMGYIITEGKIPYTDYFDHKGLLLYFFNALGILINKTWGIHLLQCLYMTLVLATWYKGLVMVKSQTVRLLIMPLSLVCLYHCYSLGNLTEDWSLLFISIPITLYLRRINDKQTTFSILDELIIGLCIGSVLMIRLNNIFPMMGVPVFCAYLAIKEKRYKYLFQSVLIISLGAIIPVSLCSTYMYIIGGQKGIEDMWFANITFNFEYNNGYVQPYNLEWVRFIYKSLLPIPFLLLPCVKDNKYRMPLLLGFLFTLLTIGKTHFFHYLIVFVPLVIYSVGIINNKCRVLLMSCIVLFNVKTFYNQFSIEHFTRRKDNSAYEMKRLLSFIPQNDRDKVWSYNGAFILPEQIQNNLLQTNRIFLNSRLDLTKELQYSEMNKICQERPKYVLYPIYSEQWMNGHAKYSGAEKDENFLKENYSVLSSVTLDDGTKVYCYKLGETK